MNWPSAGSMSKDQTAMTTNIFRIVLDDGTVFDDSTNFFGSNHSTRS